MTQSRFCPETSALGQTTARDTWLSLATEAFRADDSVRSNGAIGSNFRVCGDTGRLQNCRCGIDLRGYIRTASLRRGRNAGFLYRVDQSCFEDSARWSSVLRSTHVQGHRLRPLCPGLARAHTLGGPSRTRRVEVREWPRGGLRGYRRTYNLPGRKFPERARGRFPSFVRRPH